MATENMLREAAFASVPRGLEVATNNADDAISFASGLAAPTTQETSWLTYLSKLPPAFPGRRAEKLWREAKRTIFGDHGRRLGVPVTIRGDDFSLHLAWDAGRFYVDVDLFADGTLEWFYRDRATGLLDGTEDPCPGDLVPAALVERLAFVAR